MMGTTACDMAERGAKEERGEVDRGEWRRGLLLAAAVGLLASNVERHVLELDHVAEVEMLSKHSRRWVRYWDKKEN